MKIFILWIVGCMGLVSCQHDMDNPWEDKSGQNELVQNILSPENTDVSKASTQIEFHCGHCLSVFEKPKVSGLDGIEIDWGDGQMDSLLTIHNYGTLDGEETHVFSLKGKGKGSIYLRRMNGIQSITIRRDTLWHEPIK